VAHRFCVRSEGVVRCVETTFLQLTMTWPAVFPPNSRRRVIGADGCVLFISLFMHSSVYPSCPSVCREDVPCHFRCVTLPICHGYLNLGQSDATPLTFSGTMIMMGAEGWSWWHTECERLFQRKENGKTRGAVGSRSCPDTIAGLG